VIVMSSSVLPPARRQRSLVVLVVLALTASLSPTFASPGPVIASVPSGSVTEVQVTGRAGVPTDATAASINFTAVNAREKGYITAYPCGTPLPTASTVNYVPGDTIANSTIIEIGTGGKVCIFNSGTTDLLADITGWYPTNSDFTPNNPQRLLDTRAASPRAAGSVTEVQVTGRAGVPTDATAASINFTAVNAREKGYITAYPCGTPLPTASTVNYVPGDTIANSTIIEIGTGGKVCIFNSGTTDLLADITGWYPTNSDFTPNNPQRLLDTRAASPRAAGSVTEVQVTGRAGVPTDATAASINFTAVNAREKGYITAYPCGTPLPTASTVNYVPGDTIANSTIIEIGTGGKVCIFNSGTTDLLADITGWYPTNSDFTPNNPQRLLDTRATSAGAVTGPAKFIETFDGDAGLDRFVWGVYHRDQGHRFMSDPEPGLGVDNNAFVGGTWTADHDLTCGSPDTQRPLASTFEQGGGDTGWLPRVDWNVSQLMYTCRNHVMSTMGAVAAFSVLWFGPNEVFDDVNRVDFDVNLTYLGPRQWWKVGVVSDNLYRSAYRTGARNDVVVPGHVVSDVGSSDLDGDLEGSDRLIASWGGAASAGDHGGLKIGDSGTLGRSDPTPNDKATRHPVSLVDNANGTVTFTVAGQSVTSSGSFPACPCRVVFYDQNYTPDKDGTPIGHTWHWDNIVIR
jgi:hypothetical protein